MMTDHTGKAYVTNDWGVTLAEFTLRHRRSNDSSQQEMTTWTSIAPGEKVGPLKFKYSTGIASPKDYWWVSFRTHSGEIFTCKDSFYCSVSSDDDGNVNISVHLDSKSMTVSFSSSSGCRVAIEKV